VSAEAPAARGLLDTSVLIAAEDGRQLAVQRIPDETAISAVTVAELHVGVLAARDVDTRARRLATLQAVADVHTLAIDDAVAATWARLRVHLAEQRRRLNVNDLWIAATALTHGLPVVTQDDGFDPLQGVAGLRVIHV
jgi:predicted nucleic acid-binding protein